MLVSSHLQQWGPTGETHLEAGRSLWAPCRKLCLVGGLAPPHPAAQACPLSPRKPARLSEALRINAEITPVRHVCTQVVFSCAFLERHWAHTDCYCALLSVSQLKLLLYIRSIQIIERRAHPNDMDLASYELEFNDDIHVLMAYDDCVHEWHHEIYSIYLKESSRDGNIA